MIPHFLRAPAWLVICSGGMILVTNASGAASGLLRTASGVGGVTVTLSATDWFPPSGPPNGSFVVSAGTTLTSAAGSPAVGSTGNTLDLNIATPLPVPAFLTFVGLPALVFDLSSVGPGSANTDCATAVAVGQSCSVFAGSPYVLTRTTTGTVVSLAVAGIAKDGTVPNSNWLGSFTTQISTLSTVPVGTPVTPLDIQSFFGCTPASAGPQDCTNPHPEGITGSYSGEFIVVPQPNACPLTQGYWKNHPNAWKVTSLQLGNQSYSKAELLDLFGTPVRGDASVNLAHQLIAAKLNIANGSNPAPIASAIAAADSLLATFSGKLPYGVASSSSVGQQMVALAGQLDDYNNGAFTRGCTP